jgi:hypothetical protein
VKSILHMSLQQAAVWADCAKGVEHTHAGAFAYHGAGKYPECKPFETKAEEARMVSFVKRNTSNCARHAGDEDCHKQYHYTDVATQHDHYDSTLIGTSNHDVVAAINAAIVVLQGGASPSPIVFASKREALLLLAHYVGDIHQPLHVSAVYLDRDGQPVDPDVGEFDPATRTIGGNSIFDHGAKLHHEWDEVPAAFKPKALGVDGLDEARAVPGTDGDILTWSTQWATDTIHAATPAFENVNYSAEDAQRHWDATLPTGYAAERVAVQRTQIIRAGARLAQLLQSIWP